MVRSGHCIIEDLLWETADKLLGLSVKLQLKMYPDTSQMQVKSITIWANKFSFKWITHEEKKGNVNCMHKARKILLPCNSPFGSPSLWYTMQWGASRTQQNVNFTVTWHKILTISMKHNLPWSVHEYSVNSEILWFHGSWRFDVVLTDLHN